MARTPHSRRVERRQRRAGRTSLRSSAWLIMVFALIWSATLRIVEVVSAITFSPEDYQSFWFDPTPLGASYFTINVVITIGLGVLALFELIRHLRPPRRWTDVAVAAAAVAIIAVVGWSLAYRSAELRSGTITTRPSPPLASSPAR